MNAASLYIPIPTETLNYAAINLYKAGMTPAQSAESADFLLYPTPTPLAAMCDYSHESVIIGGNLDFLNPNVSRIDLLKDPFFLADNAAITAEAALGIILSNLPCAVTEAEILILGWGRIGKSLTHQLAHLNAPLSVYARKPEDQAMLRSLGYHPVITEEMPQILSRFRCVVNTAPACILTDDLAEMLRKDCFKLDLASVRSIPGDGVLHARGLPSKHKPESTGSLIARTILYHIGGNVI